MILQKYLITTPLLLARNFVTVQFCHITRQGNFAAYNIAKHVNEFLVQIEDIS